MKTIDERIVSIAFENAKFEAGVAQSLRTIQKLTDSINHMGAVHGFSDVEKAASKVNLSAPMRVLDNIRSRISGVGSGAASGFNEIERAGSRVTLSDPTKAVDNLRSHVAQVGTTAPAAFGEIEKAASRTTLGDLSGALDTITAKFSTVQAAAAVALGNIATQAVTTGASMVKSLTLGPVTGGFEEYSTNLNSIQTILSNTSQSGATLKDVNDSLGELNTYSDQTIYNFGQMAKAIGLFTAAGVDLDKSTASIKGIANLAALSGTNSEKASNAMVQLSQAIAAGRVTAADWNSVNNAGMGGVRFQNALVRTAEIMGTLDKKTVKVKDKMGNLSIAGESFRESVMAKPGTKSWLTGDVLVKTFGQLTGDMTDAQLASQGFSQTQIRDIQALARSAKAAATEVKDIKQTFDVAKEAIGTGWADAFRIIFGDFAEAKKTFTDLSQFFGGIIAASANARTKLLTDWKELGGRTQLIEGLKNAFKALMSVLKPIRDAFRDIFPKKTGKDLYALTVQFRDFMKNLKIGPETADNLRRTFRGLFAVMSIGKTIVGEILGVISDLLGVAGKGSGSILGFTGNLGDFLVAIDNAVTKGEALSGIFDALSTLIQAPLDALRNLVKGFGALFGFGGTEAGEGLVASLGPVAKAIGLTQENLDRFLGFFQRIRDYLAPFVQFLGELVDQIKEKIDAMLTALTSDKGLEVLQTGFLGGIFVMLKKMVGGFDLSVGIKGIDQVNNSMKQITGTLKTIQGSLHAANLLAIATAIGMLAASMAVLSALDAEALTRAMAAISVSLGQLIAAMAIMQLGGKKLAGLSMPALAGSMILMAIALDILSVAIFGLSRLSWDELARGLVGLAGGLIALAAGVAFIGPEVTYVGPALIPLAFALNLLTASMAVLAAMSWEDLAKGVLALGFALAAVGIGVAAIGPQITLVGPSLVAVGIGLVFISNAVGILGRMKLSTLAKGLYGIMLALAAIGIGIAGMPPTMLAQAAGLVVMGIALTGIAGAVGLMGSLDLGTLIKGLLGMGEAIAILAVGVTAMIGAGPGTLALLGAAAALAILAPTILLFGLMPWKVMIKGLLGVVLVLAVLAGVGALVAGPLAAMGGALQMLGLGMMAVAAAVLIFSLALRLLAVNGMKGLFVLGAAITSFILLIPKLVKDFIIGLVDVLASIAELLPKIVESLVKILGMLVDAITRLSAPIAIAIGNLIDAMVVILVQNTPKLIAAGAVILLAFLKGIADNIGKIVEQVGNIITNFLTALSNKAPDVIAAGAMALLAFLQGIADHIDDVAAKAVEVVLKFISGIGSKAGDIATLGVTLIANLIVGIANKFVDIFNKGADVILKFLSGLGSKSVEIINKGVWVAGKIIHGFSQGLVDLAEEAATAVIDFLNGMAQVIRENDEELISAIENLADAIIDGLVLAIRRLAWKPVKEIKKLPGKMFRAIKGKAGFDSHSPSKAFMKIGADTMLGLAMGIESGGRDAVKATGQSSSNIVRTAQKTLSNVPGLLDGIMDVDPTIRPVLDLSQVEKDASKIGDITTASPITADVAFGQASAISREKAASDQVAAEMAAAAAEPKVQFEQNNFSPEALPAIEIYRRTNNQLSQIRKAAGLVSEPPISMGDPGWGGSGV